MLKAFQSLRCGWSGLGQKLQKKSWPNQRKNTQKSVVSQWCSFLGPIFLFSTKPLGRWNRVGYLPGLHGFLTGTGGHLLALQSSGFLSDRLVGFCTKSPKMEMIGIANGYRFLCWLDIRLLYFCGMFGSEFLCWLSTSYVKWLERRWDKTLLTAPGWEGGATPHWILESQIQHIVGGCVVGGLDAGLEAHDPYRNCTAKKNRLQTLPNKLWLNS